VFIAGVFPVRPIEEIVGRVRIVEHVAAVRRGQAAGDAEHQLERARPRDGLGELIEALAGDELVGQVRPAEHLADAVDAHHVGVLEPRDGPGLDQEAVARGHIGVRRGQELERDGALEHVIVPEVDRPHAAAPELADDAEPVELGRRHPAVIRHLGILIAGHRANTTMRASSAAVVSRTGTGPADVDIVRVVGRVRIAADGALIGVIRVGRELLVDAHHR